MGTITVEGPVDTMSWTLSPLFAMVPGPGMVLTTLPDGTVGLAWGTICTWKPADCSAVDACTWS